MSVDSALVSSCTRWCQMQCGCDLCIAVLNEFRDLGYAQSLRGPALRGLREERNCFWLFCQHQQAEANTKNLFF